MVGHEVYRNLGAHVKSVPPDSAQQLDLLACWMARSRDPSGKSYCYKANTLDLSSIVSNDSQRVLKQSKEGVGNNFEGNFIFPTLNTEQNLS